MTKEKRLVLQERLIEFVKDSRDQGESKDFYVALELAWVMSYINVITWPTYLRIKNLLMQWRWPRQASIVERDLFREDM